MIQRLLPTVSAYVLVAANLIPLIGVLFYDWDHVLVLALFWIENLIIGAFNIVKFIVLAFVQRAPKHLLLCAFFFFHFGLFCSAHGTLLWNILDFEKLDLAQYSLNSDFGVFGLFVEGLAVLLGFIDKLAPIIYLGITALFLSRLVSFIENFLLSSDLFTIKSGKLMAAPYQQIIVMHAGLMFGALAIDRLGSTVWLLVVIVIFKIMADFSMHRKRHQTVEHQIKDI